MSRNLKDVFLVSMVLLAAIQSSFADSFRCGQKLIYSGDSAAEVLRVCGKPKYKDRGRETVRINGAERTVSIERWHYRHSRRSFERIVRFHRGKVISISVAGR